MAQSSRDGSVRQLSSDKDVDKPCSTAGVETIIARTASRDLNDGSRVAKFMDSSQGRKSANLPRPASNPGLEPECPSTKNVFNPNRCAGSKSRLISFPTIKTGPSGQPSRPSTSA